MPKRKEKRSTTLHKYKRTQKSKNLVVPIQYPCLPLFWNLHESITIHNLHTTTRKMSTSKSRNDTVLPQRARARVQREVLNLLKNAPEGIKLIVDPETGLPPSLNEIVVSSHYKAESLHLFACRGNTTRAGTSVPSSNNCS